MQGRLPILALCCSGLQRATLLRYCLSCFYCLSRHGTKTSPCCGCRSGLLSYSRMTTCGTSKRLMIYTDVAQSHFPIVMTVCLSESAFGCRCAQWMCAQSIGLRCMCLAGVTMPRSSVASCQFPSFAAATQASHRECQTNLAFCLTSCMPHFSSAAHLASDIVCASVCGGMCAG